MNNKTKFKRRDDSNIIRFGDIASRYCHISFAVMRVGLLRGKKEDDTLKSTIASRSDATRIIMITAARKKGLR